MKLFVKRVFSEDGTGFRIFDESGDCRYTVNVETEGNKQRITILNTSEIPVSEIYHKQFLMRYFTVRCQAGFFILLPVIRDCFSFRIYGSSYRFAGDITTGRFSLFDVDKSPIMTQKKCWSKYGDAYELNICVPEDEILSISVALSADMFIAAGGESTVYSG